MSDSGDAVAPRRPRGAAIAAMFVVLVALTSLELVVVGLDMERAERITTLAGLLMAKVMLVLAFFMRARTSRPAARLALAAIALAAAAAVVLMLETVFRVRVA